MVEHEVPKELKMELDKKIKVKKIFDCFSDFEEVKKYYDKEVYCADFIENFSNLKLYTDKTKLKTFFLQISTVII